MRKIIITILFVVPVLLNSQSHIVFNLDHGYWEHTNLFGIHFGFGFGKKVGKINFSGLLQIGYGERDQHKGNTLIDKELLSFLEIASTDNSSLTEKEKRHTRFKSVSDYSREIGLNFNIDYDIYSTKDFDFFVGAGLFVNDVFQFQVLDIRQGYEIDISVYKGPVNLFIINNQRFLTAGLAGRIGCKLNKDKNFYSLHLDGGVGPRKTSYLTLGLSAGGLLRKGKK